MREWVRLPSLWIEEKGLTSFRWTPGMGASHTAALMILMGLAHRADVETGIVHATYEELREALGLSKASISGGLNVLISQNLIQPGRRSQYQLCQYGRTGWAKLPAKPLYQNGRIPAFDEFHLRSANQLNALRLYFLFAARRARETNMASISYDKIRDYTGIDKSRIRSAISVLASASLVHVVQSRSSWNTQGFFNSYQLAGLEPYRHPGTSGRAAEPDDFFPT